MQFQHLHHVDSLQQTLVAGIQLQLPRTKLCLMSENPLESIEQSDGSIALFIYTQGLHESSDGVERRLYAQDGALRPFSLPWVVLKVLLDLRIAHQPKGFFDVVADSLHDIDEDAILEAHIFQLHAEFNELEGGICRIEW